MLYTKPCIAVTITSRNHSATPSAATAAAPATAMATPSTLRSAKAPAKAACATEFYAVAAPCSAASASLTAPSLDAQNADPLLEAPNIASIVATPCASSRPATPLPTPLHSPSAPSAARVLHRRSVGTPCPRLSAGGTYSPSGRALFELAAWSASLAAALPLESPPPRRGIGSGPLSSTGERASLAASCLAPVHSVETRRDIVAFGRVAGKASHHATAHVKASPLPIDERAAATDAALMHSGVSDMAMRRVWSTPVLRSKQHPLADQPHLRGQPSSVGSVPWSPPPALLAAWPASVDASQSPPSLTSALSPSSLLARAPQPRSLECGRNAPLASASGGSHGHGRSLQGRAKAGVRGLTAARALGARGGGAALQGSASHGALHTCGGMRYNDRVAAFRSHFGLMAPPVGGGTGE